MDKPIAIGHITNCVNTLVGCAHLCVNFNTVVCPILHDGGHLKRQSQTNDAAMYIPPQAAKVRPTKARIR